MRCNENKCQQLKMFHGNIEQKFDENQMLWVHFHYWHLKTNGNNWLDTYERTVNFLSQNPNLLKVRTLCQKTYIEKLFKKFVVYLYSLYNMPIQNVQQSLCSFKGLSTSNTFIRVFLQL